MNLQVVIPGLVLTTALGLSSGVKAHPDVKAFTQLVATRNSANDIVMVPSFCNFSLIEIEGRTKYMTARHCVDQSVKDGDPYDVILLDSLPPGTKQESVTDARIHKVSSYTGIEVDGKTLTIKGFFPSAENYSKRKMFTITGKARYNYTTRAVEMMISKYDYKKMLDYGSRQCINGNYYLGGLSGSVVLDDQDRAFGPVSWSHVMCRPVDLGPVTLELTYNQDSYAIGIVSLQDFLQKNK